MAGPGTGKTETVARRIVKLLKEGVRPRDLLVRSFSRSAVSTLIQRIEAVSSENKAALDDPWHVSVRTFDSWTFRAHYPGKEEMSRLAVARASASDHLTCSILMT